MTLSNENFRMKVSKSESVGQSTLWRSYNWKALTDNKTTTDWLYVVQERIELPEAAREHVTTMDSKVQTWRPDATFSNNQNDMDVLWYAHAKTTRDILVNMELSDTFVDHLLRELVEDTVSTATIREDTIEERASESF